MPEGGHYKRLGPCVVRLIRERQFRIDSSEAQSCALRRANPFRRAVPGSTLSPAQRVLCPSTGMPRAPSKKRWMSLFHGLVDSKRRGNCGACSVGSVESACHPVPYAMVVA
jgi:hypothetical protein